MNMFKIYGVTDTDKTAKKTSHDKHSNHVDTGHHATHDIDMDVEIHHDADHETDIGQIALDILDTTSSIIIVAPIA